MHKVIAADIFVYLDTVQFTKNGLQNRNQIKTSQAALWLTVPVKHAFGQKIHEVQIADTNIMSKHWKTLQANYSHTPGFNRWHEELKNFFEREFTSLADLAIASTEWMLEKLNVQTKRVRASTLAGIEGEASKLVAAICNALSATDYLTGRGALAYLDVTDFAKIGCEVHVQRWSPLTYSQAHANVGFVPDLSTLDLLLNCPDTADEMIAAAGSWTALDQ